MTEEEAKKAWMSKLDAPSWGKAADALTQVVAEAAEMSALVEDCNVGIEEACDQLNQEDEAKRAWLSSSTCRRGVPPPPPSLPSPRAPECRRSRRRRPGSKARCADLGPGGDSRPRTDG